MDSVRYQLLSKPRFGKVLAKTENHWIDNPFEESPEFTELMDACRRGQVDRTLKLISTGVNINGRDEFDYTPLIVACLCGHFPVVKILLNSGAWADRDTYQGERCMYNALNDKIRNYLMEYDYSRATDPLQPWAADIKSLLARKSPWTSDITLTAGTTSFHLHKFILSARSPYFQKKLIANSEMESWALPLDVPARSFQIMIQYSYLSEITNDMFGPESNSTRKDIRASMEEVANLWEMNRVWEPFFSKKVKDVRLARRMCQDEVSLACREMGDYFRQRVLAQKTEIAISEVPGIRWRYNNAGFADCLLLADEGRYEQSLDLQETADHAPNEPGSNDEDIRREEDGPGDAKKATLFPVHKAMLVRSPYFETMFTSAFIEAQESEHLRIIPVDCSPEVLELVLSFLYTGKVKCPLELVLDLLYAADMFLLDKLKSKAAQAISTLGSGTSIASMDSLELTGQPQGGPGQAKGMEFVDLCNVIHTAWELDIPRLEDFSARQMAQRLEIYIEEPKFAELVRESANRLKARQETDTIELLDDIRFNLSKRFSPRVDDDALSGFLDDKGKVTPLILEKWKAKRDASNDGRPQTKTIRWWEIEDESVIPASESEETKPKTVASSASDEDARLAAAIEHRILLQLIDDMLERLELDA